MTSIGLVGAGAMGVALAANWIDGGAHVRTVTAGRSDSTVRRLEDAGIDTVASLDEVVVTADLVVPVVPPGQAVAVADDLAAGGPIGARVRLRRTGR